MTFDKGTLLCLAVENLEKIIYMGRSLRVLRNVENMCEKAKIEKSSLSTYRVASVDSEPWAMRAHEEFIQNVDKGSRFPIQHKHGLYINLILSAAVLLRSSVL